MAGNDGKTSTFLLQHRKSMRGEQLDCLLEIEGRKCSIYDDNIIPFPCTIGVVSNYYLSFISGIDLDINSIADASLEEKCSVCGTVSGSQCSSKAMVDGCLLECKSDTPISSNSSATSGIQEPIDEVRSSWSITRRTILTHRRTVSMEGSRTPLVQLAKWISGRSSTYSPHRSVGMHRRSDTFTAGSFYKEDNLSPFHPEECNLQINKEYLQEKYSLWCKLFSFVELMQATCNFSVGKSLYHLVLVLQPKT